MPEAENCVAVDPVAYVPRFERPEAEPTSSRYAVGAPPVVGTRHVKVTDDPDDDTVRPLGGPGGRRDSG